jgi:hypothetical protein
MAPALYFAAADAEPVEQQLQVELRVSLLAPPGIGRAKRVPFLVRHHVGEAEAREHDHAFGQARDPSQQRRDRRGRGGHAGGNRESGGRFRPPSFGGAPKQPVAAVGKVDRPPLREDTRPGLVDQLQLRERLLPMPRQLVGPGDGLLQAAGIDLLHQQRVERPREIGRQP